MNLTPAVPLNGKEVVKFEKGRLLNSNLKVNLTPAVPLNGKEVVKFEKGRLLNSNFKVSKGQDFGPRLGTPKALPKPYFFLGTSAESATETIRNHTK